MSETRLRIAKQLETGVEGDILYRDSAGELIALAIGANNTVLKSDGTVPSWQTDVTGSFTIVGDSGSQTVENGNTLTVVGGDGITSAVTATDTLTLNVDATVLRTTSSINDLADVVITAAANGDALVFNGTNWVDLALAPAAIATEIRDDFTGLTGTAIVLTQTPLASTITMVFKNGQLLRSGVGNDYTISGTSITMAVALVVGDLVSAIYKY